MVLQFLMIFHWHKLLLYWFWALKVLCDPEGFALRVYEAKCPKPSGSWRCMQLWKCLQTWKGFFINISSSIFPWDSTFTSWTFLVSHSNLSMCICLNTCVWSEMSKTFRSLTVYATLKMFTNRKRVFFHQYFSTQYFLEIVLSQVGHFWSLIPIYPCVSV